VFSFDIDGHVVVVGVYFLDAGAAFESTFELFEAWSFGTVVPFVSVVSLAAIAVFAFSVSTASVVTHDV
jgi:hypothetical protein